MVISPKANNWNTCPNLTTSGSLPHAARHFGRGDRVAYGGGLENRFRFQANVGSNPTPSVVFCVVLSYSEEFRSLAALSMAVKYCSKGRRQYEGPRISG